MKIKYDYLYTIPILILLLTQDLYWPFLYADKTIGANRDYVYWCQWLTKLTALISVIFSFYVFFKLNLYERFVLIPLQLIFIALVFESFYFYNTPLRYPPVVYMISSMILAFCIYYFYSRSKAFNIQLIMNFMVIGFALKILLFPGMISIASFLSHERGVPSASVLMILLPCLYFFNKYVEHKKIANLYIFLALFMFILYFQHRTVWVTTAFAFTINILLLNAQRLVPFRSFFIALIPLIFFLAFSVLLIAAYYPKTLEKVEESMEQISKPDTEGSTSEWRIEQMKSYLPYVRDHFALGMRLKGYELPMQFYLPGTDALAFGNIEEADHGHHFHNAYFEMLFYFGVVGFFVFVAAITYPLVYLLKMRLKLNPATLSLVAYTSSSIVYGFGYVLPFYFWLILGITIFLVKDSSDTSSKI